MFASLVLKISMQGRHPGEEPCYEEKSEVDNQKAVNDIRNDFQ